MGLSCLGFGYCLDLKLEEEGSTICDNVTIESPRLHRPPIGPSFPEDRVTTELHFSGNRHFATTSTIHVARAISSNYIDGKSPSFLLKLNNAMEAVNATDL